MEEEYDCRTRSVVDNGERLSAQQGQHFKDGVLLFVEFSGIAVPNHCLQGLADAMIQAGVISTASVRHVSACERSKACQHVLALFSDDVRSNHGHLGQAANVGLRTAEDLAA